MKVVLALWIGAAVFSVFLLFIKGFGDILANLVELRKKFLAKPERPDPAALKGDVKKVLQWGAILHSRIRLTRYRDFTGRKIFLAGLDQLIGFEEFLFLKEIAVLLVFVLSWLIAGDIVGIWVCLLAGFGSFWLPDLWLNEKVMTRKRALLKALPNGLDLLTACVEAGLGFDAALSIVAETDPKSRLGEEILQTLQEIKLGKTRKDALKAMADRVDLQEFTSLVQSLLQADRLGTSMGGILRMQSEELRLKRRQRAEKLALEAPVKLLFPLLLCIFPVVFLIIFTPVVLQLMESFK